MVKGSNTHTLRFASLKNPKKTFWKKYLKGNVRVNHVEGKERLGRALQARKEPTGADVLEAERLQRALKDRVKMELRAPTTDPRLESGPPPQAICIVNSTFPIWYLISVLVSTE